VGERLVATAGQWSVPSSHTFQWLADGKRIRGATSRRFTPGAEFQGRRLSVRVTASQRGYRDGATTSELTRSVARGRMDSLTAPSIAGRARVGEVLKVRAGTWSPRPDSTTVRWFAAGEPIRGERGTRLELRPSQLGKRISVRMIAHRDGYRSFAITSARTDRVTTGRFHITRPFAMGGHARLGGSLSVRPGEFSPSGASMTYTWLRDGKAISGATGTSYVPGLRDVGERISVKVHLRAPGYRDRTVRVSADGLVTTRPNLSVWTSGRPGRAIVRLEVTAPGVRTPGGLATVRIGEHQATGRLVDGRLRVVLDDLGSGLRKVRVHYAGTDIVEAQRLVTTVRVPRR